MLTVHMGLGSGYQLYKIKILIRLSGFSVFYDIRPLKNHKFVKIKDILTFYPKLDYVLLGGDLQHDPYLYE